MSYRSMIAAPAAMTLPLAIVAAAALAQAPAGTVLPTHWDASGQPDGFMGARAALVFPVLLCAGLSMLMAVVPMIEPMQHRLDQSAPLYRTAWAGLLAMMALIEAQVAGPIFGWALPATLILAGTGILLILIGNILPKSRPGYFVGIRTPWTLTDPENWIATHRLGSRTMMLGGAVILIAALLPITAAARTAALFAAILFAVVPPLVYSFLFWKRRHA